MKTDLFYNSMGLCGNFTGLRMFQISAMINLKIKFEGSGNRPCAKHNEEQRESFFFFRTFRQLRQFRSFRYGRFVLLFFYAKVTVLTVKMKYDRFLQVVAEQETIIWPVLLWPLDNLFRSKHTTTSYPTFPINFYCICVKKNTCLCEYWKTEVREIASNCNRPLLLHEGFSV